jgi:hypothetical protein
MRTFSIRTVMAFVVVAAIGMAALSVGSESWAGAMLSVSFFTLTCALLGVAFGRNERRIYWTGFAALGWTYMVLTYAPMLDARIGNNLFGPNLSWAIYQSVHAEAPAGGFQSVPLGPIGAAATAGGGGGAAGPALPDPSNLRRTAIAMEALLWAFLGGWAALYFASGEDGRLGDEGPAIVPPAPESPCPAAQDGSRGGEAKDRS